MKFKEGDWLIRKWSDEFKGEVDFARIRECNNEGFYSSAFFRFGITTKDFTPVIIGMENINKYIDHLHRTEFDWRLATDEEIKEYLILEKVPFHINI